jgi:hypothetical protein
MPDVSVGRYVRYLLRLGTLPERAEGPPEPTPRSETDGATARAPVPDPIEEDRSWWSREE